MHQATGAHGKPLRFLNNAVSLTGAEGSMPRRPTVYQLRIRLSRRSSIDIGKLGRFQFPAGNYVYTGSARRNLEARIHRHLSRTKRLHWHIDFLLSHPAARVVEVRRFRSEECRVNRRTRGRIVVKGFGASDCRTGCRAHLKLM